MSWYNNDATALFPTIKAMAGEAERPDDLVYAVVVGDNVTGQSSTWSEDSPWPLESYLSVSPNPFNPTTEIKFAVTQSGHVSLELYDIRGRIVRRLVDAFCNPGVQSTTWNGRDDAGRAVPSGTYFARLGAGSEWMVERLTLLR